MKKIDSVQTPIVKDLTCCCPEFKPKPWDKKEIKWNGKFFVKDTIISLFHIPLNFGSVMKRNYKKIKAASAETKNPIVIVDELSPFHSHVYIGVTKPVAKCDDVKLTGQFLSRVFEGPYSGMKKYIKEMNEYVKSKGKITKKNYFFYPTCPKCSKKYKKNYTVILAEY
ncbi:hypothetical protein KAS08_02845 [Candidatus Pacearchaeota archaeon]|nr:hypothetical protein [Candidatus Pacearchaeota archaeon]